MTTTAHQNQTAFTIKIYFAEDVVVHFHPKGRFHLSSAWYFEDEPAKFTSYCGQIKNTAVVPCETRHRRPQERICKNCLYKSTTRKRLTNKETQ